MAEEIHNKAELDLGVMDVPHIPTCNNVDVLALVQKIDGALVQLGSCTSSRDTRLLKPDYDIMADLIEKLKARYTDGKAATPQPLYVPNADPFPRRVAQPPAISRVMNTYIQDVLFHLVTLRIQLLKSPNANQTSGFHPKEANVVYDPFFAKMEQSLKHAQASVEDPPFTPELGTANVGVNQP